jgi:hypothetical protein
MQKHVDALARAARSLGVAPQEADRDRTQGQEPDRDGDQAQE